MILLVDDDEDFRKSVREILELEDYGIIEASNGVEAISLLQNEDVDLIITDILMPACEGNEFALEVKKARPDLKVIGMTGGGKIMSSRNVQEACSQILFEVVLKKPFTGEELLESVRKNIA